LWREADGKLLDLLAFSLFGGPSAANRDIRFADFPVSVYGARILGLRRALVAATPLKVPVAVRVSGTERRIACPAILRCRNLKCPSAYRDERGSQCNNHELHENLCNLSVSRSEQESPFTGLSTPIAGILDADRSSMGPFCQLAASTVPLLGFIAFQSMRHFSVFNDPASLLVLL
jgi:hypothetical protein